MKVGNRVGAAGKQRRPLIHRREERRAPVFRAVGGVAAMVRQHDKGRQVVVQAAQPVAHPRADAGETGPLEAGCLQVSRLAVHAGFADDIVDERHVIDALAKLRDD